MKSCIINCGQDGTVRQQLIEQLMRNLGGDLRGFGQLRQGHRSCRYMKWEVGPTYIAYKGTPDNSALLLGPPRQWGT
jgi:hypothetical protein